MVGGKKNFKVTSKEMEKMKNRNLLKLGKSYFSKNIGKLSNEYW